MLKELTQLAVAAETSAEGTAVTTAAAAAKFIVENLKFTPGVEMYKRNARRASFSNFPSIPGKRMGTVEFDLAMYGTPTAANAPAYDILLMACGTVKATSTNAFTYTTSSVWDPAAYSSSKWNSLTIAFLQDGTRQRIFGARGDVTFVFDAGLPVIAKFVFIGCLEALTDTALLTSITYDTLSDVPPIFTGATLTLGSGAGSLDGTPQAVVSKMEIAMGNSTFMRTSAAGATGYLSAYIGDRVSTMKFDPEYLTIAQGHDFYATWVAGTTAALDVVVGTGINRLRFQAPAVQYQNVPRGERDGLVTAEVEADLCGSGAAGDDELVITIGTP